MPKDNESTMKWKVDVTQMKAAMQEAKRAINQANAEFKTATAGMDKWSKSSEGLEAKLQQLNKLLPAQERQLQVLEEQYKDTVKTMGENSSAAHDLRIKIEEQKATITKTQTSIGTYTKKLTEMQTAENSLTATIKRQESELARLKTAYVDAVAQYGKNSKEAKTLASQISSLSGELADNKAQAESASKAADKLDKSIDEVGESADKTEDDVKNLKDGFTVMKGVMANLAAQAITGLVRGFADLGKTMINVGKQAILSYADYEQLVGGVETLFGAGGKTIEQYAESVGKTVDEVRGEYDNLMKAQSNVLENAGKAFKTAGLSQNQYMETVTSFSASLISSLGGDTAKAAEYADRAIIDMADNANKMGTSMTDIQNAYQGFAKQNYTMLDNLKLGYGGTKEEMARLVADAAKMTDVQKELGITVDANSMSFGNIVNAISVMQEKMGIAGTTQEEAMKTITGSLNMTKAAWSNLLTGMADDQADFDKLINDFTESALAFGNNIVPRIKTTISGMGKMISGLLTELVPALIAEIPPLIEECVPMLLSAIGSVASTLLSALPSIISSVAAIIPGILTELVNSAPLLVEGGMMVMQSLIEGFTQIAPSLISQIPVLMRNVLDSLIQNLPLIVEAGMQMIESIVAGLQSALPVLLQYIPVLIQNLCTFIAQNLPQIIQMGVTLLISLIQGLANAIPLLISYIPVIIQSIVDTIMPLLPMILDAGIQILMSLIDGIISMIPALIEYIPQIIQTICTVLTENLPQIVQMGIQALLSLINGLVEAIPQLIEYIPEIVKTICDVLIQNLPLIVEAAIQIMVMLIQGLTQAIPQLIKMVPQIISTIVRVLIQNLPAILKAGVQILMELISGIGSVLGELGTMMGEVGKSILNAVLSLPGEMLKIGGEIVSGIWEGISNGYEWITGKIKGWVGNVTDFFKNLFGINSPSKLMRDSIGQWLPEGIAEGFEKDMPSALKSMKQSMNGAINQLKSDVALQTEGMLGDVNVTGSATGGFGGKNQIVNFNQTINSPKAVDRLTLYQETNSLLFSAKVRLGNV